MSDNRYLYRRFYMIARKTNRNNNIKTLNGFKTCLWFQFEDRMTNIYKRFKLYEEEEKNKRE